MSNKIISINEAKIDTEVFKHYAQEAHGLLGKIDELTKDYSELVETVESTTSIKKADVSGYFKARFKDKQTDVVAKGNLYDALNGALGDS
jgi:hypothetical protein